MERFVHLKHFTFAHEPLVELWDHFQIRNKEKQAMTQIVNHNEYAVTLMTYISLLCVLFHMIKYPLGLVGWFQIAGSCVGCYATRTFIVETKN